MKITKSTLARQVYKELHSRITMGKLPIGQRLLPSTLADELSISQTPVKEALALLERDGLVTGEERRGAVVRAFTPKDIEAIYDARSMIERHALEAAFQKGLVTEAFKQSLEDKFKVMSQLSSERNMTNLLEFLRIDRELHSSIVAAADNPILDDWHRLVLWQTQTVMTYSVENYFFERAMKEHRELIDAICAGDLPAALEAISFHMEQCRVELVSRPPEDGEVRGIN
ncbi:GntR family transcriptional regulator [Rhodobacteraceae bacterium RKSG542]|uniref:GntR family transcriptional regulator n=1 Tax=Pseudovibrio flavus TaxID=2529854 RepID=UPI0012BC780B|nr:GntR family transcriptional regulator [Pseudovibrio flavus]MTI17932.1 GntR family transcriptional regulator [Pseudovibrio flavus]